MSVSGIFGNSIYNSQVSSQYQMSNSEFQQLGQDLTSGNLSAAQSDFAALQQIFGQTSTSTSTSTSSSSATSTANPIAQAFQQLSSDLNSGNLSGAQKDYSTIQQDLQSNFGGHHLHNHHIKVGAGGGEFNDSNQLLQALPSSTSSTSASTAQQQYATLAQELEQVALGETTDSSAFVSAPISMMA